MFVPSWANEYNDGMTPLMKRQKTDRQRREFLVRQVDFVKKVCRGNLTPSVFSFDEGFGIEHASALNYSKVWSRCIG